MREFEARMLRWFGSAGLDLSCPAVVAYSGGPDSTALLAALLAIQAGPLLAVHIDHGFRAAEERRREAELTARTAEDLGCPWRMMSIPEGEIAEAAACEGIGIEAAARERRMRLLRQAAEEFGAARIYVGHTCDDKLEGLLMRFLSGSGSGGLRGIGAVSGMLARPLLDFSRRDVEAYLRERGVAWSTDSTNKDLAFTRNRIRARLVPLLDSEFPGWRSGLLRGSSRLAAEDEALDSLASALRFSPDGAAAISTEWVSFATAAYAVRFRALAAAVDQLVTTGLLPPFPGGRVPGRMLDEALAALARNRRFEGHGLGIFVEGSRLKIGRSLDFGRSGGYFVVLDESDVGYERPIRGRDSLSLAWTVGPGAEGIPEGTFDFPLIARSRRPGDRIFLAAGSRAIDRLVSEWKVDAAEKDRFLVIEDRSGIVALMASFLPGGRDVFRRSHNGNDVGRRLVLRVKGA